MKHLLFVTIILIQITLKSQNIEYPVTKTDQVVDTFYTITVNDEYRWLENITSQESLGWINAQNTLTKKELRKIPLKYNSYDAIDRYSYTVYENPQKQGDYYFTYGYYNNVSVPALFCKSVLSDNATILVDPNFISNKDNILLRNYSVSKDSKLLAFQYSRNGSDWGEIKIVNINTGIYKNDHLTNIKFSGIAWKGDGFYYSKYPDEFLGKTIGQEVYYHTIGTEQSEDKLIFKRANNPTAQFYVYTSTDERFLILKEKDLKNGFTNIFYIDFNAATPNLLPLLTKLDGDNNLSILDNLGDDLICITSKNNNNRMVIKISPEKPRDWQIVIPEFESALLLDVKLLQEKIIATYIINSKQQVIFFDYQGNVLQSIALPYGFSINDLSGEKTDKTLLLSYSGYTQPKIVYILNTDNYEMKPLRATVVNFDYTQFETKEVEYESFDGTKVPLFLIYKKGLQLNGNNPTLLKAYGGFGVIVTPNFDPALVHFLNEGGIFAFANIRGGGDKGDEWAKMGKGEFKQNSFNDFIAAAEYLINNQYTSANRLAITGGSNGGLVVGAAMTQRSDLFKAAVPVVGVFDMIRFEKFTIGHFHTNEYGTINDSSSFFRLLKYSPLHNISDSINYPATLIMTSDNDDRVPPFHSYKFAAKLQNRPAQKNPILLRVEEGAGHYGAEGNFRKILKESADMYDFILYHLNN